MAITSEQYENIKQIIFHKIDCQKNEFKFEDIDRIINETFYFIGLECSEQDLNELRSDIEYKYKVKHTEGYQIYNDYDNPHTWYTDSDKSNIDFWLRYKSYLYDHTTIDPNSINLLDTKTLPSIMNCLSNPMAVLEGKRFVKGLVIGDVQSGKTATYSGLICKAADAGYKVVILLAGVTENLRKQTQERVDEGIVGHSYIKNSIGKDVCIKVGVGLDNKPLRATSYTSCVRDFTGDCDKISTSIESHKSLILFVIKKNVTVLNKLYTWLKDNNINPVYNWIDEPMLLIDDEADNASVNTKKDETDPTKTNKLIRQICELFKNTSYVGFTATPFANVFIDPDSVDAMNRADLFPRDFIYTLPTPSTYIGAQRIFYEDGEFYKNLRFITDIEEPDYTSDEYKDAFQYDIDLLNSGTFYYRHTKYWRGILPNSLRESVLCYFIVNIIRDLRGQQSSPRSMLVNMSRFVNVQRYIKEAIKNIYDDFIKNVRYHFQEESKNNVDQPLYQELKSLWNKHFSSITDISFSRVVDKLTILNSVESIKIIVVNGSKDSDKLDYKNEPSLRVIAVGGLALSRGLTLEGLIVSYFYRNTATFDVLMQMGRWFGYRSKYEDLFQIWTSRTSADWYAEIARSSQELKDDIRIMFEQKLTPMDFGIRVRDNCEELQITAPNKMRNSYQYNEMFSYYGNIFDTPYVSLNVQHNKDNLKNVGDFVAQMFAKGYDYKFADIKNSSNDVYSSDAGSRYFVDVDKGDVVDFLSKIHCSLVNMYFNTSNILKFIQDSECKNVEKWDIVFANGKSDKYYDIKGLENIKCSQRAISYNDRHAIQISSRRRLIGAGEGSLALSIEEKATAENLCRQEWMNTDGLSKISAEKRNIPVKAYFQYLPDRKPILIIYMIDVKPNMDGDVNSRLEKFTTELGNDKIVAFAIGFPGVSNIPQKHKYKVNKIYYDLYMQDEELEGDEDDEE